MDTHLRGGRMQSFRRVFTMTIAVATMVGTAVPALSQTRLDTAIFHPESAAWTAPFKWWIDEVEKATQGRVKFIPHYAGSLVSTNETFKALRDGAVPAGV